MINLLKNKNIKIGFKKINEEAIIPFYSREGDACLDICSIEDLTLRVGETKLVKTGLGVELPKDYKLTVKPRSGLAINHSITVLNSPGTVDYNYKGEIGIILINLGTKDFEVTKGMRVAQIEVEKVITIEPIEIDTLSESNRGDKGFGSSGLK